MGALEYQAMPSLSDVAHDGVLCKFTVVIDQPQTGATGVVRQGRRHGPSITYKITPCWAAVLGHPSRFWPPCLLQSSVQSQHHPAQRVG
jgi:hypothetical protein